MNDDDGDVILPLPREIVLGYLNHQMSSAETGYRSLGNLQSHISALRNTYKSHGLELYDTPEVAIHLEGMRKGMRYDRVYQLRR